MRSILVAASVALILSLVGTPLVIRFFRARGYGQLIRDDGPQAHLSKRGTPTMGGTAIILAAIGGYLAATLTLGPPLSPGGLLAMGVFAAMGAVGFLDDYIKIRRNRSLGLTKTAKFVGQGCVALVFAVGAEYVADTSTRLSFIGATNLDFGLFFPVFCFLILAATSNAVNLTDGLDGLAAGTSALVFGAYTVIAFWIFRHRLDYSFEAWLHSDALAIAAASALGASLGFLWWNAPPAKIFMGDTGSLAIGGMFAALSVLTETELLLVILGGLYVVETTSVIAQVVSFRLLGRRVFKMAPLHHHFELVGWHETTVIVRFWIVGGLAVAFGLGLFYAEFLARGGIG
ncbi:MAG TPA: phospho-N-acetylmuramoyl-pentapeptide-transferase [Egibacteraceae bacterium]|nr:phospho-N-acetylmuramoyl-pentapeptide-transferase [Actinomycetota bacterium]HWB71838.1 phospho-N-acetylmuramoyl-pentapeptide-transferase [Egibacteraceae bacterium]